VAVFLVRCGVRFGLQAEFTATIRIGKHAPSSAEVLESVVILFAVMYVIAIAWHDLDQRREHLADNALQCRR
jgi:hypothetical protein